MHIQLSRIRHTHYPYVLALCLMITGMSLVTPVMAKSLTAKQSGVLHHSDTVDQPEDLQDDAFDTPDVYDPWERMNRATFSFNHQLDRFIIRPVTIGYRTVVPKPGRKAIHNVFRNLREPVTFLNATLQGDARGSFSAVGRFMINSTFGLAGLYDVVHQRDGYEEDFGQTLGHYHVGTGPYLVLPVFGPSNVRDGVGLVADTFSNPTSYLLNTYQQVGLGGAKGLDTRESVLDLTDDFDKTSLDPYATYRSLFSQHRQALINGH